MRKPIAVATIAIAALALSACSAETGGGNGSGSTAALRLSTISAVESFAPGVFGTGPVTIALEPVYDSLFRNDDEGVPGAHIATEWSYDDTNTVLSLTLRDDVTFTDGTALDADAVKQNLDSARTQSGESGGQLRFLSSVDVVDATHLTITLTAPDPSLLSNLGGTAGMLASPAALGSPELATVPVGSGPYEYDEAQSQAGTTYVYDRNEDYWDKDAYPYDSVTVTVYNDATSVINSLRSGQLDSGVVDAKEVAGLESAGLKTTAAPAYTTSGLFLFDRAGTLVPALGDVRVRQAINYALDRSAFADQVFGGEATATDQMFSADSAAYDPALEDVYPYDVDKAKALLAEAGYADGFDLPMPDVSVVFPAQQAAVTEALTAIGIRPQYQPVNGATFISDLLSAKYPAAIFGLNTFRPWDVAQLSMTSQSVWNTFKTDDATVNDLITTAQTQTGDEQDATFKELNSYIVEQAWYAPYAQQDNVYATSSSLSVTPQRYLTSIPLWNYAPAS